MDVSQPHHRTIFAVDVEGSTERTNTAKAGYRRVLYELVDAALAAAGIGEDARDRFIDSGDGVMVLVHPVPRAPKTLLLDTVVPRLSALLAAFAGGRPEQQVRLRAVLHAGEVHFDERGCYGEAMDLAFRLLNARGTKRALRSAAVPLVLVASDHIYTGVIRHNYRGIDAASFAPLVYAHVAGRRHRGWVQHVSPAADVPQS